MPVRREIEVEASPEEVFDALATEEGRDRWLDEPGREVLVETSDAPHRLDILTFVAHAGPVPDRPTAGGWPDWLAVGSRAWTARVLWQALDSTFGP